SKLRSEPDRVAQVAVVELRHLGSRVQRVPRHVQRRDREPTRADRVDPLLATPAAAQQRTHVAVRRGRVAAGPDLDGRDARDLALRPVQDLVEGPLEECVGEESDVHFTAPSVRPRTKWRCTSRAKMTIGSAPTTPAAAIGPHAMVILPIRVETPTGMVWESGVDVMVSAIRKSL